MIFIYTNFNYKHFIILCLLLSQISCTNNNQAASHLNLAEVYYSTGKFSESTKEIYKGIKIDSTICEFYILLSKIKSTTNSYDEAIQILKSKLNQECHKDTVYYLIGNYYFKKSTYFDSRNNDTKLKLKSLENALLYLDSSLSINTFSFNAYVIKQRVYHNLDSHDKALATINNALNIFPDNMVLIFSRGVEKIYLGDPESAMIDLSIAIESNKLDSIDFGSAYRFRAGIYKDKGNLEFAISDLTNSIKRDPTNFYSFAERGEIFQEQGQKEKACDDFRKSANLGYIALYEQIKKYCN